METEKVFYNITIYNMFSENTIFLNNSEITNKKKKIDGVANCTQNSGATKIYGLKCYPWSVEHSKHRRFIEINLLLLLIAYVFRCNQCKVTLSLITITNMQNMI